MELVEEEEGKIGESDTEKESDNDIFGVMNTEIKS